VKKVKQWRVDFVMSEHGVIVFYWDVDVNVGVGAHGENLHKTKLL
jgi:hypothetical protein